MSPWSKLLNHLLLCYFFRMNTSTHVSQRMNTNSRMTLVRLFIIIMITMLKLHFNSEVEAKSQKYAYTHTPTSSTECLMHAGAKTRSKQECVVDCQKQQYPMKLPGFTFSSDGFCYCLPVVTSLESRAFIVGTADIIPGEYILPAILAIEPRNILEEWVQH